MSESMRALVALGAEADRDVVQGVISEQPSVEVAAPVEDLEAAWHNLDEVQWDVLIVGCSAETEYEEVISFISGVLERRPDRPVLVLCHGTANGFVARAFAAGADEIVMLPADGDGMPVAPSPDSVLFALEKAVARRHGTPSAAAAPGDGSKLVCVLGPKGGTGKTVVASNLGVALADAGHSVALVDLDLQFGDLGLVLGTAPERTVYDLATSGGALDAEKLDAYLATHDSGARVLMAPTRPDQANDVGVEFLRKVYAILRSTHEYVVVDTPPGFTAEVIASIDGASDLCMVGMLDAPSLKSTKLGLETLRLMGKDPGQVKVVLNRADSRVGITEEDVEAVIGRRPDVLIPSHRDVARSVNDALPVVLAERRSEASRAFRALAESYVPATDAGNPRRGVLRRRKG
jgi:pilus assembly protein CpaE